MWLFTTQGFFSAVEHREDRGLIMVRARVHRHITHLRDAVQACREGDYQASEALEIIELEDADYRFRLTITREEWVDFVMKGKSTKLAAEADGEGSAHADETSTKTDL